MKDVKTSRQLIIAKKGAQFVTIKMMNVALFYTINKLVFIVDKEGNKYLIDDNLGQLEEELDEELFFRANRQYIINAFFIKAFKKIERVKLMVEMDVPNIKDKIIVSQVTAPFFKKWISSL
jgi:DNA-binding LytR/AlgR family response regulator